MHFGGYFQNGWNLIESMALLTHASLVLARGKYTLVNVYIYIYSYIYVYCVYRYMHDYVCIYFYLFKMESREIWF